MKKLFLYAIFATTMIGCAAPVEMQVRVAPLGEEVPEASSKHLYILPQTVLKVVIGFLEVKHIPGPYWEYAERYLGITEVIRRAGSHWQIVDVKVEPHSEMDPDGSYHINVIEGAFEKSLMEPLLARGVVLDGTAPVQFGIRNPMLGRGSDRGIVRYVDLGIESNFDQRKETMYKTIVTDTSFVEVPVTRTVVEEKSLAMKAEEAAEFILELRSRRFEMLTGEYEGYPQGEAMTAAISKLDELESSYLSLFTGKTIGREEERAWFIIPEPGSDATVYQLGLFSGQLGFVPETLLEGDPLSVHMNPLGMTGAMDNYYSTEIDSTARNVVYYRVPDVVDLKVVLGNETLSSQRLSVYQSGAMVAMPLE